jgi:hypothetical protein
MSAALWQRVSRRLGKPSAGLKALCFDAGAEKIATVQDAADLIAQQISEA